MLVPTTTTREPCINWVHFFLQCCIDLLQLIASHETKQETCMLRDWGFEAFLGWLIITLFSWDILNFFGVYTTLPLCECLWTEITRIKYCDTNHAFYVLPETRKVACLLFVLNLTPHCRFQIVAVSILTASGCVPTNL